MPMSVRVNTLHNIENVLKHLGRIRKEKYKKKLNLTI